MKNSGYYIFLFVSVFGFSQSVDYSNIDTLLLKAHSFYKTNQDSALYYAEIAYNKSVERNNIKYIAKSIIYKNTYLIAKKEYDKAELLFDYNIKHLDSLNEGLKGDTFYNLGSIKYLKESYDLALENYSKSISHYKKAKNIKGLQRAFLQIGVIYSKRNKKDLANYFYDKSMNSGKNSHQKDNGENLSASNNEDDKLNMSKKMLSGISDVSNSRLAAIIYYNMGQSYYDIKDFSNVIIYNQKSIEIKDRINYVSNVDKSYALIGESYFHLKKYEKAILNLKKAYNNSIKREFRLRTNRLLSKAYENNGDYKNALKTSNAYNALKDSLNLIDENERIAKITAKFETEKQAQEIVVLESDNKLKTSKITNQKNIIWASAIVGALLLISLFFAYKNHKTKRNLQFSELTQKLLQMQLNPHFLFNALNGIQYFIKKNDVKKSTKYISSFSGLMRNILENSVEKFISIEEDCDTIKDFLELQQLVNNNSFSYKINIDENLDIQNMCIPPMFTQPFVENAIIHGVSNVKQGKIEVNYLLKGKLIVVEIIDNGKGIETSKTNTNSLHKSMGTSITKQRMENLLKTEKYPVELEIISKSEDNGEQGTKIVLSFPIKYV